MKIKTKFIVLGIIIAMAGILALGWYIGSRKAQSALNELILAQDSIRVLKIQKDGAETTAYQVSQIVTSQRRAIRNLQITNAELKALNVKHVAEISRLKIRIDTLLTNVPNTGKIIVVHDTITEYPQYAFLLPFEFQQKDQWLNLRGVFDTTGHLNMSLTMDMSVDIVSGIARKSKERTISVVSDNSYITPIKINSFKIDEPKKKRYGLSFMIGYGVSFENPIKPVPLAGFGITYDLLSF